MKKNKLQFLDHHNKRIKKIIEQIKEGKDINEINKDLDLEVDLDKSWTIDFAISVLFSKN